MCINMRIKNVVDKNAYQTITQINENIVSKLCRHKLDFV